MVETIRKENPSLLLLDCGDISNRQSKTAELILKAMDLMKYDALALGGRDIRLGHKFLERSCTEASFPCIASNLLYQGKAPPWAREYIIKESGGIKVGVIGLVDPDELKVALHPDEGNVFQALPPEAVLNRLLPEIREKADVVILLSQLDIARQFELLNAVKGVDVSISSAASCKCKKIESAKPENTAFLYAGSRGGKMGFLKVALDDKRVPLISETRKILMGSNVPENEEIAKLVEVHKTWKKEERERLEKEMKAGLELTPKEFMERYQQEQYNM